MTSSVPRWGPLTMTSLQRLRLTVAGLLSRRMRVPERWSIAGRCYHAAMYAPHPHGARSIDRSAETRIPYRTVLRSIGSLAVAASVLAGISAGCTTGGRRAERYRDERDRALAGPAVGRAPAVVHGRDHQGRARPPGEAQGGAAALLPQEAQARAGRPRRPVLGRPDLVELDRGRQPGLLLHRGLRRSRPGSTSPRSRSTSTSRSGSSSATPTSSRAPATWRSATSCGRRSTPSSRWPAASSTATSSSAPAPAGSSTTASRA